jgi:hypothetical protein
MKYFLLVIAKSLHQQQYRKIYFYAFLLSPPNKKEFGTIYFLLSAAQPMTAPFKSHGSG